MTLCGSEPYKCLEYRKSSGAKLNLLSGGTFLLCLYAGRCPGTSFISLRESHLLWYQNICTWVMFSTCLHQRVPVAGSLECEKGLVQSRVPHTLRPPSSRARSSLNIAIHRTCWSWKSVSCRKRFFQGCQLISHGEKPPAERP